MRYIDSGLSADELFLRELHSLRRHLWLERVTQGAWRGLWIGLVLLIVGEVGVRLVRASGEFTLVPAGLPVAAVLSGIGWSLIRRPTLRLTARTADRRLQLREQLATALELIQSERTPFGAAQVARAGRAAARMRIRSSDPVRRRTAGAVLSASFSVGAAVLTLASDEWLASIPLPGYSASAENAHDERLTATDGVQSAAVDSQALLGSLQQLMQPVSEDESPSADQIASTEQALAERTAASRATQQSLSTLANALQQVSAGQTAADALNSGDYAAAVANVAQLGQNSDQLSPEARRTLSNALLNASRATTESALLADRERRAGEALKYPSYGPTAQALQNLADSVNKASQSILSQEQLSAAWQRLQAAQQRAQKAGGPPPAGTPATARLRNDNGDAQAGAGGPPGQTDEGAAGRGNTSSGFEPDATGTRLNVAGVPVQVPLQISAGPSRQTQPQTGDQSQTLQVVSDSAAVSGEAVQNVQAQPARAERNAVPPDLRPVVRGYFNTGTPSR